MSFKKNDITSLVVKNIPEFIRIDHPSLVAFLEAYYEWLSSDTNAYAASRDLKDTLDVDNTLTEFIQYFKEQYLQNFPKQLAENANTGGKIDEKKLIKNIRDFYESKGTEKAFQLLFRILYDSEVEFYYPKVDILRVSDGKWIQEKSLRITNFQGNNIFDGVGKTIKQIDQSSLSITGTAVVTRIQLLKIGPFDVAELFLKEIKGSFYPQLPVVFEDSDLIYELAFPVVTGISITDNRSGYGHRVGEDVIIRSHSGKNAAALITRIGNLGEIQEVSVTNFGVNYEETPIYSKGFTGPSVQFVTTKTELAKIQNGETGVIALGDVTVGALCEYPGYYANNDGIISSNKVLQDGRFYQNYSYVLKTETTIDKYRDDIKKLIHPAGYAFFGQVLIKRKIIEDVSNYSKQVVYDIPLIGHYLPYTIETWNNFASEQSSNTVDGYGEYNFTYGYDSYTTDSIIQTYDGNPYGKIREVENISRKPLKSFVNSVFEDYYSALDFSVGEIVFQLKSGAEVSDYYSINEQDVTLADPNIIAIGTFRSTDWNPEIFDVLTIDNITFDVVGGTFYNYGETFSSGITAGLLLRLNDITDSTIRLQNGVTNGPTYSYFKPLFEQNLLTSMGITGSTFSPYYGIKLKALTDHIEVPFSTKDVNGFEIDANYNLVDVVVRDVTGLTYSFYNFNLRVFDNSGTTGYVAEYIPNTSYSYDYDRGVTNFSRILINGYTAQIYRSFVPLELSTYENATPFWTIHEHPNARISGVVTGKVRKNLFTYNEDIGSTGVVDFRRTFVQKWTNEWRPDGVTGMGPTDREITNWLNSWTTDEKSKVIRLEYTPYYERDTNKNPTQFNKIIINNFTKIPTSEVTYLDNS